MNNVSFGGRVKESGVKWKWYGVWYKPWTWLKWKKLYIVKDFQLLEFSFVSNPIDPNAKIKE